MYSYGGNAYFNVGQMTITGAANQIPFPSNFPPKTGIEGARRKIRATDDIWIGPTSAVTVGNGYRIPAETEYDITARGPVWFVGAAAAGESSSSSLSQTWVTTASSSSCSSSQSGTMVVDYGTLSWLEEGNG